MHSFRVTRWSITYLVLFVIREGAVPFHIVSSVVLILFFLVLLIHGRQTEWTHRLDFLWKMQVGRVTVLSLHCQCSVIVLSLSCHCPVTDHWDIRLWKRRGRCTSSRTATSGSCSTCCPPTWLPTSSTISSLAIW
ncbi:ADCY1 [Cordylochernes scorpioides]|uniref:ADCY1 n=1 Tax=Cordylochernes scorpioides TaxID=51811 RepID=A0ABY6KK87_9ARAC|nr:ADCY1 [Cordylochernes scorpioides]